MTEARRGLAPEMKDMIYAAIGAHRTPADREPEEEIKESFGGDEERYLRWKASEYGISIE